MHFTHITTNQQTLFTLDQSCQYVFFLHNQSGEFTFHLNNPGAEVSVFALFTGKKEDTFALKINQIHAAPETTSHAIVHFLGKDQSSLDYKGLIRIEKNAGKTIASQKNVNLLLSDEASAFSFPSLEILTDDVICHHGSTTSRINREHLLYAQTRGLTEASATQMLADGFIQNFFDALEKQGVPLDEISRLCKTFSP